MSSPEGPLVHVRPHVSWVERVTAQVTVLGGHHGGELVEGGLGRAVATPAGVCLDRGVGADIDDRAAGRGERAGEKLDESQRCKDVCLIDVPQCAEVIGPLRLGPRDAGELRVIIGRSAAEAGLPRLAKVGRWRSAGDIASDGGDVG
jgi:hypothetical protein